MLDIVDGNLKLILGLIWTLILQFTIQDIRFLGFGLSADKTVRKVLAQRKGFSYGVNERHLDTKE
jgi:hypothetical protein